MSLTATSLPGYRTISQHFTTRALLGDINTHDSYLDHREPLSGGEIERHRQRQRERPVYDCTVLYFSLENNTSIIDSVWCVIVVCSAVILLANGYLDSTLVLIDFLGSF